MLAEPYKIKEVKHLPHLEPHTRWNLLKEAAFNTYRILSENVTFDMVARGMSAWTQDQKAGYMIGDEAYAGSRNYMRLLKVASENLGIERLVPTHNGIGAEKLLCTTMMASGQIVLHNRGRSEGLVPFNGGELVEITSARAGEYGEPGNFGADVDTKKIAELLKANGKEKVAYVHVETCPDGWNGQPVSMANLKEVKALANKYEVPFVVDISNAWINALWNARVEKIKKSPLKIVREMVALADIVMTDASQDCRSDVGGFVTSANDECFEKIRNQVVVFEGLHTYGGMTGRAMEVFAVGMKEMQRTEYVEWYDTQVDHFYNALKGFGVPCFRGCKGVALDVDKFLPHLKNDDYPKFVLTAALFIHGGIRPRIDGALAYHTSGSGKKLVHLELPRMGFTQDQLHEIAACVADVYDNRDNVSGLKALGEPEFVDQAMFEPQQQRLFVTLPSKDEKRHKVFEPHKVAIIEPVKVVDKETRRKSMERAGYNTFLLDSEDIVIDLLTDSGTTAMSSYQWEGMTNTQDTPYSSRQFVELAEEFREVLGFKHCIPTHQGRAAEHIMSQTMIKEGMLVPGNMYFTTTKLHQEMAGGLFRDVIVDEAHDPESEFPWKGNIDLKKLQACIDEKGPEMVAYVSFEMAVNMAGGQPFSMENVRDVSEMCRKGNIPLMFDATRCVENARMIQLKDPAYRHVSVEDILREMMSYGDGCTVSCKKDFMVNMGGLLACNNDDLADKFYRMLRIWEGEVTTGGMDPKDMEALRRGFLDSLSDEYIEARVEQTQELGRKLKGAGIPIVNPPGTHAIFLNAREFLSHLDQDEYPAQALAAAIFIETGVRAMERGNVSKGRNPETGENYRPALELVRLTIPRRAYTNAHMDFVVEGVKRLWKERKNISGLNMVYEPKVLRFFQGRFEPKAEWKF